MSGEKKSLDPAVMAAIITVSGGIIIALINVLSNRVPSSPPPASQAPTTVIVSTATQVDTPVPTDTVPAGEPTSTPEPPTPTLEPTITPLPIGTDWANGCISTLWQVAPADGAPAQQDGCLQAPVGDFSILDGKLVLLANRRFDGVEIHGMFAPLSSQDGEVNLKVDLSALDRGEVWMGVFSEASIDSTGAVVYIPPGDILKRVLVTLHWPDTSKNQTKQYTTTNAVYDVKFRYNPGSVTVSVMNGDTTFNPLAVSSAQKWLFIGYRTGNGVNNIGATFFDLTYK